ncbi:ISAs1 family transposase [Frankia sp. Cr1]|uniref:ISAs1 family transposase n=1 Tax=Frankia sp. Cr1 TaxID=3073931 RepID=UPI002AD4E889|nr:ISAs1 family transposase [Frankia sp. Cr1]
MDILSRAVVGVVGAGGVSGEGIWERLATVPHPRARRGLIYLLPTLIAVWLCALTAPGHDRVAAVTEWLAGTSDEERRRLRLPWDPRDSYRLPDESTIRRMLAAVDDARLAVALLDLPPTVAVVEERDPPAGGAATVVAQSLALVGAVAVDGKTSRGAKRADGRQVHLLGAVTHGDGLLVGQREVDAKSNETTAFRPLLTPLDLEEKIVTFDALHTVRANLDWLVTEKKAHYLDVIKGNQSTLKAFLAALPWAGVPTGDTTRGHGRDETRTLKVATVTHLDFPHADQAIRIQRWRQEKGRPATRETVYAVTDATARQAGPALLADLARGHWHIEVKQHYVRDVAFGEDASTSRAGRAPAVLAIFRAAVINALRRARRHRYIPGGRRAHKTATAALNLHDSP